MSDRIVSAVEQAQHFVDSWDDPEMRRFAEEYAAEQTIDFARLAVEQADQITKVREARSIINRLITYSGEAISMDSTTLAKSIVNKLNDALGDTDD